MQILDFTAITMVSKSWFLKHQKIMENLQNNAGKTEEWFVMWAVCFSMGISMIPPDFMLRSQSGFQPALQRLDPKCDLM